jgi:hypothetical protein
MSQIANGTGSLGQLEHLMAPTAAETLANLTQYFTAHPQGADSGALVLDNLLSLKKEQEISQQILNQHKAKLKSKHPIAFSHPQFAGQANAMYDDWTKDPAAQAPAATAPAPRPDTSGMAIGAPQASADAPNVSPGGPPPSDMVKIQAPPNPDGTPGPIRLVQRAAVAKYVSRGGKVVP